jgi:hypothetical protein
MVKLVYQDHLGDWGRAITPIDRTGTTRPTSSHGPCEKELDIGETI